MRLVTYQYDGGQKFRFKTTTNGLRIVERYEGKCLHDERMETMIDSSCWDTKASMHNLLENLKWTIERLQIEIKNNEEASAEGDARDASLSGERSDARD